MMVVVSVVCWVGWLGMMVVYRLYKSVVDVGKIWGVGYTLSLYIYIHSLDCVVFFSFWDLYAHLY